MIPLHNVFDISYGNKFDVNKMSKGEINFVGRSASNNGVTCTVRKVVGIEPYKDGLITVALGGSVLSTFLQPAPFYTGQNVAVLSPKISLSTAEKLCYCTYINANAYRFTACGREANRFLAEILIPSRDFVSRIVKETDVERFSDSSKPLLNKSTSALHTATWEVFAYNKLFEIKKGIRLTKADMLPGKLPYIGASDTNNGVTAYIGQSAIHEGNTISVSYNGSVGEAFYQPAPYWATDDVNVFYPKCFGLTPAIALFICTLIRQEKYRFSYGRKWTQERMRESTIKLPVTNNGQPDWKFMESYINSLPYSSQI